jgi:hypothetical protein
MERNYLSLSRIFHKISPSSITEVEEIGKEVTACTYSYIRRRQIYLQYSTVQYMQYSRINKKATT